MKKKRSVPHEIPMENDASRGKDQAVRHNTCPVEIIPDYVFESLALCALPIIQAYYESEEGKKAFEEWKKMTPERG